MMKFFGTVTGSTNSKYTTIFDPSFFLSFFLSLLSAAVSLHPFLQTATKYAWDVRRVVDPARSSISLGTAVSGLTGMVLSLFLETFSPVSSYYPRLQNLPLTRHVPASFSTSLFQH
jgi:hypothetical protein